MGEMPSQILWSETITVKRSVSLKVKYNYSHMVQKRGFNQFQVINNKIKLNYVIEEFYFTLTETNNVKICDQMIIGNLCAHVIIMVQCLFRWSF